VRDIERGIRAAAAELKQEAKDAKVSLASGGEFAIAADEAGQEVNTAKLAEEIREYVRRGEALATLFADSDGRLDDAEALLTDAFRLQPQKPPETTTIYKIIH